MIVKNYIYKLLQTNLCFNLEIIHRKNVLLNES